MRLVVLFTAVLLTAPSSFGQSLLTNPGFDDSLSGWFVTPAPAGPVTWNPADVSGASDSGSALLDDTAPCTFVPPASWHCERPSLSQCVAVTPGLHYIIGLSGIAPAGGSLQGSVAVFWDFFDGPACRGTRITGNGTGVAGSPTWRTVSVSAVAPPGASSVLLTVQAARNEENLLGGFVALVDNVVLENLSAAQASVPMAPSALALFGLLIAVIGVVACRRAVA